MLTKNIIPVLFLLINIQKQYSISDLYIDFKQEPTPDNKLKYTFQMSYKPKFVDQIIESNKKGIFILPESFKADNCNTDSQTGPEDVKIGCNSDWKIKIRLTWSQGPVEDQTFYNMDITLTHNKLQYFTVENTGQPQQKEPQQIYLGYDYHYRIEDKYDIKPNPENSQIKVAKIILKSLGMSGQSIVGVQDLTLSGQSNENNEVIKIDFKQFDQEQGPNLAFHLKKEPKNNIVLI